MSEAANPARVIKGGGWPGPVRPARSSALRALAPYAATALLGAALGTAYLRWPGARDDTAPPEGLSWKYPPFALSVEPAPPDYDEIGAGTGVLDARPFGDGAMPADPAAPPPTAVAETEAAPAAPSPPPPATVVITREARMIHRVEPEYPAIARNNRIEGTVVLQARVTAAGDVASVEVVSGSPMLAAAAVRAVEQWRYEPALRDGAPIPALVTVTVNFTR